MIRSTQLSIAAAFCVAVASLHLACGSVTTPSCPDGTRLEGGACVSTTAASATSCGPGTRNEGGVCLPSAAFDAVCPGGGVVVGGRCVAPEARVSCGPGTELVGSQCVAANDAGATEAGSPPKPSFDVRIGKPSVSGNGYSRVPVFAIARADDGSPLSENVILGVSRQGSGSFEPYQVAVGPLGTFSSFTSCDSSFSPGCAAKTRITMARASAPDVVVAQSEELEIIGLKPVWSADACRALPNVIHLDGQPGDLIHPGVQTITRGNFYPDVWSVPDTRSVTLFFQTNKPAQVVENWHLHFSTAPISQPLAVRVYDQVTEGSAADAFRPTMSVSGPNGSCSKISGEFQVHKISFDTNNRLSEALVSFEQRCNGSQVALRGCVHYTR
jgi:hypothetical protein